MVQREITQAIIVLSHCVTLRTTGMVVVCHKTGDYPCRYEAQRPAADVHLSERITKLALERRCFGYRRIWQLLCREGHHVNHKRVYPATIRTDQGPEFTCRALDQWAFEHGVELRLIQPGKPTQSGFIESFNDDFAMNV